MLTRRSVRGRAVLGVDGTLTIPLAGRLSRFRGLASLTLVRDGEPLRGLVSYRAVPTERQEPLRLEQSDPAAFPNRLLWVSSKARALEITMKAVLPGTGIDYALESVDPDRVADALDLAGQASRSRRRAVRQHFKNRRIDPSSLSSSLRTQAAELHGLLTTVGNWDDPPLISIVTPCWNSDPGYLDAAVSSVLGQHYAHWELILADDGSTDPAARAAIGAQAGRDPRITVLRQEKNGGIAAATNAGLARARGTYVAFLDHDDLLDPAALLHLAVCFHDNPDAMIVYTDEDIVDADGNVLSTHLKPDFDELLLVAQNYLCHLTCMRRSLLTEIGGLREGFEVSQDHELILRASRRIDRRAIVHIPRILYHWRQFPGCGSISRLKPELAISSRLRAARIHLDARGWDGDIATDPWGNNQIRIRPPHTPSVTVIVPTRDRADLLSACIGSVRRLTDHPGLEILIMDNGTTQRDALSLLDTYRRDGIRVIRDDSPFNFSALCNKAVDSCRSDFVLFLNNDIEVTDPGWLDRLLSFACLDDAGAVGCKLVFADGRIQHAGIAVERGGAGHPFRGERGDFTGFVGRAHITRQVSAVTGACLMVSRQKYLEVGGMDAAHLPIIYNDVDLCLKLQQRGYRNIYVGDVCLIHHESATRGETDLSRYKPEFSIMNARWGHATRSDPYFRSEEAW